jgi:hypothetical protein
MPIRRAVSAVLINFPALRIAAPRRSSRSITRARYLPEDVRGVHDPRSGREDARHLRGHGPGLGSRRSGGQSGARHRVGLSESVLGTLHGVPAVREFLQAWWAAWEDHHHYIEEICDFGRGVMFVALLEDGRPVGSKGRVQARNAEVFEWLDRKIVRITAYGDIDKGRAAAEHLAEERG